MKEYFFYINPEIKICQPLKFEWKVLVSQERNFSYKWLKKIKYKCIKWHFKMVELRNSQMPREGMWPRTPRILIIEQFRTVCIRKLTAMIWDWKRRQSKYTKLNIQCIKWQSIKRKLVNIEIQITVNGRERNVKNANIWKEKPLLYISYTILKIKKLYKAFLWCFTNQYWYVRLSWILLSNKALAIIIHLCQVFLSSLIESLSSCDTKKLKMKKKKINNNI